MKQLLIAIICTLSIFGRAVGNVSQSQQYITELKSQGIENAGNPKIRELYEKLNTQITELEQLEQKYMNDLRDNAQAMKDKEQSTENKLLGAAGMGATGIGGMQMASAMAEQNADADAERDMTAYLATFHCNYGGGKNVEYGETNVELPGGNDLIALYAEYVNLANDLKVRKVALDMRPGIESEPILESATSGLYDDIAIGKTSGAYASLARALLDPNGADAAEWATQESDTAKQLKTGAITAGIGAVGSAIGNLVINKDAPKERSEQIKSDYETQKQKKESEISDTESQLNDTIAENKKRIEEYNALLTKHSEFVNSITEPSCINKFSEYSDQIKNLTPITDNFADTSNLEIPYDLQTQQSAYTTCVAIAEYNAMLAQHQEFIATIIVTECIEQFNEYIQYIKSLEPIQYSGPETQAPTITYNLGTQQSEHTQCVNTTISQCESQQYHKWIENNCVDQTPVVPISNGQTPSDENPQNQNNEPTHTTNETPSNASTAQTTDTPAVPTTDTPAVPTTDTVPEPDPNQCPTENPRMRSLTDKNYVGDFCIYGNLTAGRVFKRSDGTCSCTATACKPGYRIEKGMCVQDEQALVPPQSQTPGGTPAVTEQIPNLKYFAVCRDDKGKSGGTEYCITKPFNWINVQMLQATALAAEYALVKNGHDIRCQNEWSKSGNDDWFSCTSIDNKNFYEFKFDDAAESVDVDIQANVRNALCSKIYDGSLIGNTQCKLSDATQRKALINSAKKFGITATEKNNRIYFDTGTQNKYTTKKIDGINPFAFYNGDIQIRANGQMIDALFAYVALQMAPRELKTFTCNNNPVQIYGQIDDRKIEGSSDDVLTCYANGTPVDFVFQDMSELSRKLSRGGYSNMNCTIAGGTFNGYECMHVGEMECKRIKKLSAGTVPASKLPFWNSNTEQCELPAAADATQYQRNINMGIMVGGMIVGVVVTVLSAGTAAPVLALVAGAVETVGAAVEIVATQEIYNAIDEFMENSQKCKNATCAEQMLRDNINRMANMTFDMTDAQIHGIDAELARLADIIPTDSEFYKKIAETGTSTADNSLGFFDANSWEPEQVWRAVGVALQLTSVLTSVGKWIAGKSNKLVRATRTFSQKAKAAADAADAARHTSNAADAADTAGDSARAAGATDNASDAGRTGSKADDAGRTNSKTNDANNTGKNADDTGKSGQKSTSGADNAARGTGDDILHDDLVKYRKADAAQKKKIYRQLSQKYHPDKIAEFNDTQLTAQADDIFKHLSQLDTLSDEELKNLSKLMKQFDTDLATAQQKAKAAAEAAEQATKAKQAETANRTANSTSDTATTTKSTKTTSETATSTSDATRAADASDNVTDAAHVADNADQSDNIIEVADDTDDLIVEAEPTVNNVDNVATKRTTTTGTPKQRTSSTQQRTATNNARNTNTKSANARKAASGARTLSKADKIEAARKSGNLGYHGTDADIAMDDMIRSSANSSDNLGSVGYGIAQDYSAAEKYAIKRLIERQNIGKNISFYMDTNGNLVVQSTEPLNLSNKTGYVYTTAKRADMTWDTLNNGYVGPFKAAQMPESVEILEKTAVDLDDLIKRGKVKIDIPNTDEYGNIIVESRG